MKQRAVLSDTLLGQRGHPVAASTDRIVCAASVECFHLLYRLKGLHMKNVTQLLLAMAPVLLVAACGGGDDSLDA